MRNEAIAAAIRLGLSNPEVETGKHLYHDWEPEFINRWGVEVMELGRGAQLFMATHSINLSVPMTFAQAARIFHNNTVRFPGGLDQLRRYVEDFDKIPPELAEVPLDQMDWDRMEKDDARWNPKPEKQIMDMAPKPVAGEVHVLNLGQLT